MEPGLGSNLPVDAPEMVVVAQDGATTLKGHLGSNGARNDVERIDRNAFAVTRAANTRPVDGFNGDSSSDRDLAHSALSALEWNALVPTGKVKPLVRDGWLILEGEVEGPQQKRAAEDAVRHLNGIRGVSNNIVIECEAMAQRVSQKITETFVLNARVNAHRISVTVHDHKVILTGSALSTFERDEAEAAAWAVPGVAAVVNGIRIP
jgi:osmotically-inducible protein OsmY